MAHKKILKSILNVKCIKIISCDFNQRSKTLYIRVDITKGKRHRCPICGKKCPGYDSAT